MENFAILLLILFGVIFGGLILAMLVVGTVAMFWLCAQILKWTRQGEKSRAENAGNESDLPGA